MQANVSPLPALTQNETVLNILYEAHTWLQ